MAKIGVDIPPHQACAAPQGVILIGQYTRDLHKRPVVRLCGSTNYRGSLVAPPSRRPTLRPGERSPWGPADQQANAGRQDGGATSNTPRLPTPQIW
ncbi:MAG TPA: hypothetical protein VH599_17110 [Ktedonobacterales bacterium]